MWIVKRANRVFKIMSGRMLNLLTPNDDYSGRTAPLTSERCIYIFIQQI